MRLSGLQENQRYTTFMILLMSLKKDPRQAEGEVYYMQVNPIVGNTHVPKTNQASRSSVNGFMSTMAKAAGEPSSYKVYVKKDDMLYSGGNGTGLSFYLKYAEDSTAENPKVVAHGVDENGPSTGSGTFAVYPNPTDGILFVQTLRATSLPDQTYRITNLMGQTSLQGLISAETQQIDISSLPAGMYFISMGETTLKFVKR